MRLGSPASAFFREGRVLLAEETAMGDAALYLSVLAALAGGATRRSQIAAALGRKETALAHPLRVRLQLGEDVGRQARAADVLADLLHRGEAHVGDVLLADLQERRDVAVRPALDEQQLQHLDPHELALDASDLSGADRIRRMRVIAPVAVLFYCLIVSGGVLDGWAGFYYAFQRMLAELLLSLYLIEHDFNAATEWRSHQERSTSRDELAVSRKQQ